MFFLTALILSQATPTVIVDPTFQSSKVTTTASGAKRGLDTICLNCSASSGGGDGGFTTVVQGPASDGGVDWPVRAKLWDGADTAQVTATSGGALQVECVGGTCGSAAPFVDNSAFTFGTTSIGNAGAVVDDVATNVVAENSAGAPRMTVQRGLHANLRNAAGTEVGSAGSPLRVDPTGGTTQPVSGTVTTAPPANATTNVAQFGGTNVATGTGVGGAGIPRVTLSSDSSLAANQSVNTAQVNGATVNVGTGAAGTGTQRVAVASDSAMTANAGTNLNTSALALSATQTDRTQKSQITDGTRDGTVKAASTAAIATDTSLVVGLSPNSPLPAGTAVIGHVIADTGSTTAVTGNVTAVQPTGTNLHVVTDATSTLAANQSVNVSQVNGVATSTGIGASGTGTIRTASLVHDGTDTLLVTTAGSAQTDLFSISGTAVGTAAAGVQKVGIVGNANAAVDAANNAAAPANVLIAGAQLQSGATATAGTAGQVGSVVAGLDHVLYVRVGGPVSWSCFVPLTATATTECRSVRGAGIRAYVTSISCSNGAATVQGVDVVFGTGTACATGTTALTHKYQMGTNDLTTSPFEITDTFGAGLVPTAATAICLRPTAATAFGCTLTGYDAP